MPWGAKEFVIKMLAKRVDTVKVGKPGTGSAAISLRVTNAQLNNSMNCLLQGRAESKTVWLKLAVAAFLV